MFGCLSQFRSTDSGATFSPMSVGHADTHTWTMVPQPGGAKTVMYCGCDGGMFVSTDAGGTWKPKNKGGLQTGLFYNIAIKPDPGASRHGWRAAGQSNPNNGWRARTFVERHVRR